MALSVAAVGAAFVVAAARLMGRGGLGRGDSVLVIVAATVAAAFSEARAFGEPVFVGHSFNRGAALLLAVGGIALGAGGFMVSRKRRLLAILLLMTASGVLIGDVTGWIRRSLGPSKYTIGAWSVLAPVLVASAGAWEPSQSTPAPATTPNGRIAIDAVAVPLNPQNPAATAIGDFHYAGGLALTAPHTNRLHGLSDLVVTNANQLFAVGDEGVLLDAQLVLDGSERLVGITDARLSLLTGEDGRPLVDKADADAEGLAQLPNGDLLVSFERRHRILLYPAAGGAPRRVPSPSGPFPANGSLEAVAADPDAGADAYVVGGEASGDTWTCRLTAPCIKSQSVGKPEAFGLVGMRRLPGGQTAYLLRAYDRARGARVTLMIYRATELVARMEMSRPLTVDNFEGLAAVTMRDGGIRFYLISDDNSSRSQRTLLFALDWRPR